MSSSIHNIAFVKYIVVINESRQTPVITLDQPLYVIAKAIHWDPTTRFNEDNYKYFVSLGSLRKEMCENMLGDWVRDSGWVEMLIDADVSSPGRVEALIKGSHVTWTCYAHQVTALSLSILERMPNHDTRLSVRRMGLNAYRSKPGAYSKVARCPN